jgi:hypothetical protein
MPPNTDLLDQELEALLNRDPENEILDDIENLANDLADTLSSLWPTAQTRARAYIDGIMSNVEKLRRLE